MRELHIVLAHHCILHRGVNFGVSKKLLYLLNRHSFVYCPCCKCSAKFMGVYLIDPQHFAELSHPDFHTTNFETIVRLQKRDKQCRIVIGTALNIISQMNFCSCIKVYGALLASFSEYDTLSVIKIDIRYI